MKQFLKLLQWTLNAAVFFTLFAFALNNQHEAKVYFFFGTQWRSPMVLIVLIAFALGMVVGVLGMVPRWWRQKQAAKAVQTPATPVSSANPTSTSSSASSASTATSPSEVSHGT